MWEEIREEFHRSAPGLTIDILPVQNLFFGPTVTVTGLLAGDDIITAIREHEAAPQVVYLIPEIVLKQNEDLFLDGVSVPDLHKSVLPKQVEIVPTRATVWLDWMIERFCSSCSSW
jgi:NifB/MoaA-like Fe-S oxidoreductase